MSLQWENACPNNTQSWFRFSPTFQESVCCNGEEGQLKEGLAENEGLEPLRRVHHHWVFKLLRIPPENIFHLQKSKTVSA